MTEDYQERLSQLAMLIYVSQIDGEVDDEEQALVDTMAERLEIKEDDKHLLMTGELVVKLHVPSSEWERVENFHLCMMMSSISGEFDSQEALFCKRLGLKMGVRDEVMNKVITLFRQYHPDAVPVQELKRVYQIGHN
jgi:hypothetical protein